MDRHSLLLLVMLLAPACGGDDDGGPGTDGDADADADGDGDGDADGDADACALPGDDGEVALDLLVDTLPVRTCVDGRWRLNVRVCGEATDPSCGSFAGGPCGDAADRVLLGDACESSTVTVPTAGHYTLCVEAELVNGSYTVEECTDIDVGPGGLAEPLSFDLDSEGQFPCNRDWAYDPDENMCCNLAVGYCAPPDF